MGSVPAGYRCGRTGASFMTLAKAGDVHKFCIPNAILTLSEYLQDYASPATRVAGRQVIEEHLAKMTPVMAARLSLYLEEIDNGRRDLRL